MWILDKIINKGRFGDPTWVRSAPSSSHVVSLHQKIHWFLRIQMPGIKTRRRVIQPHSKNSLWINLKMQHPVLL
ncbi:hypothetical protein L6452_33211 [Arctium lappa]|uniref:Uncharacterized protein n=1 Tax=Arctium lappa TaxID=4217 RepID=A0ACB8Z7C3_ARCLA|nr:hypothetical protein L6452_33211 [Arctium lappa]